LPREQLSTIDMNDPLAFAILNDKKYTGIFQFNGLALQSISEQIAVSSLNDIVAITALARPGPLNSGSANKWIKVHNGREPESYPHPLFEEHLKGTLGVVAYQEQVMTIGRDIGGLSWEDVSSLRKAMAKSLGAEFFDQYGDRWKAGGRLKGIPDDVLNKTWDDLCAYGSWAFNLSHALAYGVVSYYCCWLKAHYPIEFAAATLSYTENAETQKQLLRELEKEGVGYIAVDKELSIETWSVGNKDGRKVLVGPLTNVVGIGPKTMAAIISARARGEPMPEKAAKLLSEPVTNISSLYPIKNALDHFTPALRKADPPRITREPTLIADIKIRSESQKEIVVWGVAEDIIPRDINEELKVAKRGGYRYSDPTKQLNIRIKDDTGVIMAIINRKEYEALGRPIVERGKPGKVIYGVKGEIPPDSKIMWVNNVLYIGDLDEVK
jgi:DNA polymerase-3 subunit alpha